MMASGLIFDDDGRDVTMDVLGDAVDGDPSMLDGYTADEIADALRSLGWTVEPPP